MLRRIALMTGLVLIAHMIDAANSARRHWVGICPCKAVRCLIFQWGGIDEAAYAFEPALWRS
jgi:hypothetical protein